MSVKGGDRGLKNRCKTANSSPKTVAVVECACWQNIVPLPKIVGRADGHSTARRGASRSAQTIMC